MVVRPVLRPSYGAGSGSMSAPFRTIARGTSFWASSPGGNVAADPSIAGAVVTIPDPDARAIQGKAPRSLSLFVPAEVLRAALASAESRETA